MLPNSISKAQLKEVVYGSTIKICHFLKYVTAMYIKATMTL